MLILCDLQFLGCLTYGHTCFSLRLVAFLPRGQPFARSLSPATLVPGTARGAAGPAFQRLGSPRLVCVLSGGALALGLICPGPASWMGVTTLVWRRLWGAWDRPAVQGWVPAGLVWFDALRDGLKVAGYRPVADALAPADLRVAFFGDLSGRKGAKSADKPPYTAVDLRAGPERDLLESSYEATGRRSRRTGAATAADPAPAGFSLRISYPRDLTTTLAQTR
jgi:hypothetical protein